MPFGTRSTESCVASPVFNSIKPYYRKVPHMKTRSTTLFCACGGGGEFLLLWGLAAVLRNATVRFALVATSIPFLFA